MAVMTAILHLTREQLEAGLDVVRASPTGTGVLEMIVRRPAVGAREVVETAEITLDAALVGDNWPIRPSTRTTDKSPHPDCQITLANSRAIALVAGQKHRWPLAGDQLYVDLDLSPDRLPPGTRLAVGSAVLQVTEQPHTGCGKFAAQFGKDAMKFVNSPVGRSLNLRGINARVIQPGTIRVGDVVSRL